MPMLQVTAAPNGWIGGTGAPPIIPAQKIANVPLNEWPFIQAPSVPAAPAGAAFVASPLLPDFVPLYKVAAVHGGAGFGPTPSFAADLAASRGSAAAPSGPVANLAASRGSAVSPSGPSANLARGFNILSSAAQVVDGACEIVRKEMGREQLHQTSPPKDTGSERYMRL